MLTDVWDHLSDGVVMASADGVIVSANAKACRMYGLREEQILGQALADLPVALVLSDGAGGEAAPEARCLKLLPDTDGPPIAVQVSHAPLPDGGVLEILRDVSAELDFMEMQRDLGSTLSHDIRTGLSGVMLGLDALIAVAGKELSPSVLAFATRSRTACDRVLWLVSDAHDAVRLPAGLARLNIEDVRLSEAVNDGLQFVREDAADAAIEVNVAIEPATAIVRADPSRLVRLVHNLAKVALDASPRRTLIRISSSRTPDGGLALVFALAEGADIPQCATSVFDAYRTEEVRTATRALGRGCGFRFARAAAAAHGWTLAAEEAESGLSFRVELPPQSIAKW